MSDLTRQIILSGIILCLIGVLEIGIEIFAAPLTTDEILEQEWVEFSCGSPPIFISLPKEPRAANPRIPEELWEYLVDVEAFSYKESDTYQCVVSSVTYVPFIEADVKGAAKGAIEEMGKQKGISNLKFKENPYTLGKLPGIIQYGTFEQHNEVYEFTCVYFTRKHNLWQVVMSHKWGDMNGRQVTQKILKSLRIKV